MSFQNAHPTLARALAERGYAEPTPVQAAVLEADATDKDLLVSAQTGSGKTVAYGLAIAPSLLGTSERFEPRRAPLALVVAPTRELALQVQREHAWLYAAAGARIVSCVGGMDLRGEQRQLGIGAHVVVGTPGRLRDHQERGRLDLSEVRAVVLDEADEMLDLGFKEDLELLLGAAPAERRTLLFSATLPREIVALAKRHQKDAVRIATASEDEPHGDIEYRALDIPPHEREHAIVNVLRYHDVRGALVFCSTREAVRHLHGNLLERGFAVVALSGELSQPERTRALQALRDGRARVCVATDVAARGLDLPDLGLVIHGDLPNDPQVLLHRSGRTGRAGKKGVAVMLVPRNRRRLAERLIAGAGVEAAWSPPPSAEVIRELDQKRLVAEIAASTESASEEDLATARALLAERTAEQLAAALVRLHRDRLPAPEEVETREAARARSERDRDGRGGVPDGRAEIPHGTRAPRARASLGAELDRPPRSRAPRSFASGASGDSVWYRMNVGRARNADPRWLLPIICRRGNVTKAEIGSIRIFEHDTRFEVLGHAVADFDEAIRRPDTKDRQYRIERALGDDERPRPGGAKRPYVKHPGGTKRPYVKRSRES
jgi:ATP-dependent RNA helicase DeaD